VKEAIAGAPLDGVRHPEDGVDDLGVGRSDVELKERCLHRLERLEALFEESLVELCEIDTHERFSQWGSEPERW
jgi:hypothetical protein